MIASPRDLTIRTARLALVPIAPDVARAVMAQEWDAVERALGTPFPPEWRGDGWGWLAAQASEGAHDDRFLAWGNRLLFAVGSGGPVLGEAGFHAPPGEDGWVEIGYQVVTAFRRRGYAEEAGAALIAWAREQGVAGVVAAIDPTNEPSQNLVRKLGFRVAERHHHEVLGEQLRFRLSFSRGIRGAGP